MATYLRDGTWKLVNGIYVYINSWRTVNSAWVYDGNVWKQVHSTGTFAPEIRDANGNALSYRNVGVAFGGYRGYETAGTATFQWQYSLNNGVSWINQDGTGNSGTYASTDLSVSYTTDTSDVASIESIFLNSNDFFFMRLRVTRLGETQFSQNVRIGKRLPINASSTLSLLRTSSGITYPLTGATNERNPYPNDQVFWTPNFTSTTNITNDTRPDYYIFTFQTNSGVTERDSRILDVSNPRNPLNARRYTVQNGDIGGPIVCDMNAWNSNENAPRTVTIITRAVTTNVLIAPTNLVSSFVSGSIVGTWDAASGGNDTTITYVAYLFQNGSLVYTSPSSTATTFSFIPSGSGDFRFYVIASQSGSSPVQSEFSNTTSVVAPAPFSASIADVTPQYPPGNFSINAPTLHPTILNRWDWTWSASTGATTYDSKITRPSGSTSLATGLTATTDWWTINQTGNHTQEVTAINASTNYVRISWTKPFGTSAQSYRIIYTRYVGFFGTGNTLDVGDVTFADVTVPYSSNPTFESGNSILLTQITAFSGPNQTGVQTVATSPSFPNNYSIANKISIRAVSRTDFLALENPTVGSLTVAGIPEPGQQISLVPGTGWSPAYENWSKTYDWIRSGVTEPSTASTNAAPVISATGVSIGERFFCEVTATYKGTTLTRFSSTILVVPVPPTYNLTDTFSQRFQLSGVSSISATQYYGSYSGVGSGTIPETTIGSTFTSPQLSVGNVSVTLYARKRVNLVWPSTQNNVAIDSTRFTTQNISLQAAPQSTGQRRFLFSAPSINPGNTLFISTNGYFGNNTMPANNYLTGTLPSPGAFLNIAAQDLVMSYCFTRVDSGGVWIRYRGERFPTGTNRFLEYQAYLTFSGSAYVLFIENSIEDYRVNLAYFISGVTQSTYINDSALDSSSFTINQGTAGWTSRTVTSGTADDGVVSFSVTAPARQHQAGAVTRTGGGFTFNVTNVADGIFESAATYTVTINRASPAAVSINASTGLVTVTGLTSNQFADVTVIKTRFGFENANNVIVQGQALAGAPATQITSMTFDGTSGTYEFFGTPRRAQVGAVLSGSAGTYNNQQSISSGILTILSNSYTGADSNWTGTTPFGTSVTMSTAQASASANMYRWRDRVTGTDGSVTDFYSSAIFRAVYAPPPGGTTSATQNSISISYTGGSGPQRYYRFQDGVQLGFVADGGAGPFVASFTGLTADTNYNVQLFGGNTEGFLSIGFLGGIVRTSPNKLSTPTGVSATTTRQDGINVSWNAVAGAAYYGIWFGPVPSIDSAPDFGGPNNAGGWNGLGTSFLDTSVTAGSNRVYYVQAYASGNPAGTKSDYSSPGATGTRALPPVSPPVNTSQPTLSGGTVVGNTLTYGVGSWSNSPTSYSLRLYRGTQFVATSETLVASSTSTSATYTITQADFNSGQRYFRAFATATNSGGTSNGGTFTAGQEVGPITEPPVVQNPTVGFPTISYSAPGGVNTWSVSATATNATNVRFEWEASNVNGGPARTSGVVFGGVPGTGTATAQFTTTSASGNNWGRVRARANSTTTGLSSDFTAFTSWT
jgi:hypothetical protein